MKLLSPENVDYLGSSWSQGFFILVNFAQNALLTADILDVQLAPHFFHQRNVIKDLDTVPIHRVIRSDFFLQTKLKRIIKLFLCFFFVVVK